MIWCLALAACGDTASPAPEASPEPDAAPAFEASTWTCGGMTLVAEEGTAAGIAVTRVLFEEVIPKKEGTTWATETALWQQDGESATFAFGAVNGTCSEPRDAVWTCTDDLIAEVHPKPEDQLFFHVRRAPVALKPVEGEGLVFANDGMVLTISGGSATWKQGDEETTCTKAG